MPVDLNYWPNIVGFDFGFAVSAGFNNNAKEQICVLARRIQDKYAVLQLLSVSITGDKVAGRINS